MRAPVPVILNRSSGSAGGPGTPDRVREAFRAAGREADVQLAANGKEVVPLARRAASGASDVVVAGGGDGTVSCVASILAGGEKALGILPLGTLNHFAKDLKIPMDLEQAARSAVEEGFKIGKRDRLDRGELSVYLAPDARPIDLVFLAIRAFFGRLRPVGDFEALQTTELRIDTRTGRARVATDGEISMLDTPLLYRVRPKDLRVVVPQ